jgi:hypothetical protein
MLAARNWMLQQSRKCSSAFSLPLWPLKFENIMFQSLPRSGS